MPSGFYENYYDKVTQYVTLLSGYAQKIEPGATAKTFRPVAAAAEEETVFKYIDTASTRAEIGAVTAKLATVKKVAIVGLGGTGSYVLDLVAKTPVGEIHLFDGDDVPAAQRLSVARRAVARRARRASRKRPRI